MLWTWRWRCNDYGDILFFQERYIPIWRVLGTPSESPGQMQTVETRRLLLYVMNHDIQHLRQFPDANIIWGSPPYPSFLPSFFPPLSRAPSSTQLRFSLVSQTSWFIFLEDS